MVHPKTLTHPTFPPQEIRPHWNPGLNPWFSWRSPLLKGPYILMAFKLPPKNLSRRISIWHRVDAPRSRRRGSGVGREDFRWKLELKESWIWKKWGNISLKCPKNCRPLFPPKKNPSVFLLGESKKNRWVMWGFQDVLSDGRWKFSDFFGLKSTDFYGIQ